MTHQILRKPRLSHARFSRQKDEMAMRLLSPIPMLLELSQLRRASHETVAHELLQRICGRGADALHAQRREFPREIRSDELKDILRAGQAAQLVRPQPARRRSGRRPKAESVRRG